MDLGFKAYSFESRGLVPWRKGPWQPAPQHPVGKDHYLSPNNHSNLRSLPSGREVKWPLQTGEMPRLRPKSRKPGGFATLFTFQRLGLRVAYLRRFLRLGFGSSLGRFEYFGGYGQGAP